ncbi:spindle and kinetochore-associated protein 2 [Notolabrus celidotus]|uniref:spindle and kinetochore-associated protein 2 n=1 Tax=Notolabrus celidotus TaxID=1203425 RepID=UPI00148FAD52|nr:spindle and kinetochore-associated protein 2 [Notolabrus celidotus]XP_034539291.1 spindle and kinetochore-associated protein 2 [Notolabrus celidotus]
MESTVERLEAMFSKSEADLEYIEKRLKLDFINKPAEENPAVMLENLKSIRSKHSELCTQLKEISAAHSESMKNLKSSLSSVSEVVQNLQQNQDLKVEPLTDNEKEAAKLLESFLTESTAQISPSSSEAQ